MKLKPKTCVFYAQKGKFLGHIVSNEGIYVNPDKVKALIELKNLYSAKDIESLYEKLAAMGRFLAKSAEKSLPISQALIKQVEKK